jgi:hypothetical protein
MRNEKIGLIKSYKTEIQLLKATFFFIMFVSLNCWLLGMSVSERADVFYWGRLFSIESGSGLERVFDALMMGFCLYFLLISVTIIILSLIGKNYIDIYNNRLTLPHFTFPGYFSIQEIQFSDIKHIVVKHLDRYSGYYKINYWFLYIYTCQGKKFLISYQNKRKDRFDAIHALITEHIPPEALLPPPKRKWRFSL